MNNVKSLEETKKFYPVTKINMEDITYKHSSSHKVRTDTRNFETYNYKGTVVVSDMINESDAYNRKHKHKHRKIGPDKQNEICKITSFDGNKATHSTEVHKNVKKSIYESETFPTNSNTIRAYARDINKITHNRKSTFSRDFLVENLTTTYNFKNDKICQISCCCGKPPETASVKTQVSYRPGLSSYKMPENHIRAFHNTGINTINVYNAEIRDSGLKKYSTYNCLTIAEDIECKCSPPKPSPPCKTFNCDCITEIGNITARKQHRSYCPCFKHKSNCPVMMSKEDEEKKKLEEEEDEAEPLPYGLPPIQLGPCPVMGKPCANPDGFAKMYKTQAQATLPVSYSDAGKVCCSKEYERIKKAIKDYMRHEKDHDYRCINKFNVDTERRCCDKEQRLISLMGKDCCGTHKLLIQEKYKEGKH